jgi:thymidylate synthase ThyX
VIEAKIVADSINPDGQRITSFVLEYPRFIHGELMTHRVFSRNAASSRAIPIQKMIDEVVNNPAAPIYWAKNQKGMQSGEPLPHEVCLQLCDEWNSARDAAVERARRMSELGVHKSIANRILEPFMHMVTLVTATDYANFFALRAHPAAQPEFQALAYAMLGKYLEHKPEELHWGEWHIPFGDRMPEGLHIDDQLKVATARAARLSYKTFDGVIDPSKDILLHDGLVTDHHMSPTEHPARAEVGRWGNFNGWKQYRQMIPGENIQCDLQEIWNNRPEMYR